MVIVPRRLLSVALLSTAALVTSRFGPAPRPQDPVLPGSSSHTILAAYDTFGPEWRTTLLLNNSTRVPITVYPKVYAPSGAGVPLPAMRLDAHEHRRVDFDRLIAPLGAGFARGSLQLQYVGAPMGVGAIVSTMNSARSLVVEALLHSQMDFKSSDLEAIWRAPSRNARMAVSLTNISDHSLNASVTLTARDGAALGSRFIPLAPHQTKAHDLSELIEAGDLLGSISVRYDQTEPGAILAQGFIVQPEMGFSYDLPFVDPATLGDTRFSGAGIPLGPIGGGNQPAYNMSGRLLLRNLSDGPLNVAPTLQRASAKSAIGQVTLSPGETKELTVPSSSAPPGTATIGIEVPYNGLQGQTAQPGQLVAQWLSVDDSGNMVAEVPLRSLGPKKKLNGSNPFYLAGDYSSITYIKNIGDKVSHVLAYIDHAGGNYMIGLNEIKPGETLAIDIRKLRDDQVKDQNGNTLPTDLLTGHINWRIHDGAQVVGRTSVMSLNSAIAENRSCGSCTCSPTQVFYSMADFSDNGDGTASTSMREQDYGCDQINGPPYSVPNNYFYWYTDDETIATVDGSGTVTYQGPGSVNISASNTPDIYQCQGPNPVDDGCNCPPVDNPPEESAQKSVTSNPPIVITVQFTGSKSAGDNLLFSRAQIECSESLGLQDCTSSSGYWLWNLQGHAVVSDDAANWTVAQSVQSHWVGQWIDANGGAHSFSCSSNNPSDGPEPQFLQKPSGQKDIFWIDGPGQPHTADPSNPCQGGSATIGSMTLVFNFQVTYTKASPNISRTVYHYVKIVVSGGQLSSSSGAGYGNLSLSF